jgi:hypothetical protein
MPLDLVRARSKQAGVAQLVEQRIRNAKVVGSTPISGTKPHQWLPDDGLLAAPINQQLRELVVLSGMSNVSGAAAAT